MLKDRLFYVATGEEIRGGRVVDRYYLRSVDVLEHEGLADKPVAAEFSVTGLPEGWVWAVFCGVEELANLLRGRSVDVYALDEGSLFHPYEPVVRIEGSYREFVPLATALIGLLSQSSGVATKAARCKKAAGGRHVIYFGSRRMHPAISPMLDRSAFVGGCDGVTTLLGAELIGEEPSGTMYHGMIIVFGDPKRAWRAFDEALDRVVPRYALVDTFYDEKTESIMALEVLGENLEGIYLDTPKSRRGNVGEIIRETLWELRVRGRKHVIVVLSGGLDEYDLSKLPEVQVFGVGSSVANAPALDFAMDIVEVDGKPLTKRGKLSGRKQIYRCPNCFTNRVVPLKKRLERCPDCGSQLSEMMKPLIKDGNLVRRMPRAREIRDYVLSQLEKVSLEFIQK